MFIILSAEMLEMFVMQNYYSKNLSNTDISTGSRVLPKIHGSGFEHNQYIARK